VAVKLFRCANGQLVDVEHATDAQFQEFVIQSGIRVNAKGIAEWSFDDRCGVINYALRRGIAPPFVDANNSEPEQENTENNSENELFVSSELASEGR
jgi:hypothetical protein